MYRKFNSIIEAYQKLKRELEKSGKPVFNVRTNRMTKELIAVTFKVPIDFFMTYYQERPENIELETAFDEALKTIFKDRSARYAVGIPSVNLNKDRLPCPIAIQILVRSKPTVIVYFRSQNIEMLIPDFAVIARKIYLVFGKGEIIWFIGSLHLNL